MGLSKGRNVWSLLGWIGGVAFVSAPLSSLAREAPDPVRVMIVGVSHMANPGHDLHNMTHDDVLAPRRQAEIEAVTGQIARFGPTKVAIEMAKDAADAQYASYLDGSLAPSRSERVQLGFRLAKRVRSRSIFGIDADGDFPFEPVKAYAEAHGMKAMLDEQDAAIERDLAEESRILATGSIGAELRYLNNAARLSKDNAWYRTALFVGSGDLQPGADLLSAWYRRNLLICAKLLQISRPGDRIVVFFGAGHAFLLRQCVSETPGFVLVEPNDYLR